MNPSILITPNAVEAGKLFSIIPTNGAGDLDVVRATSATRVDENGLIEIPATNLLLRSEEFNNGSWTKTQLTATANTEISPSGLMNADTLTGTTVGVKQVFQTNTLTASTNYTLSVYAKKGTNNFIQFLSAGTALGSSFYANFDLNSGVIGDYNNTIGLPTITDVGNGWYRCVATGTSVAVTSFGAAMSISLITSATSSRAESNSLTTSVFLWGAQLEQGSTATEYIPTTSVVRTRFAGITQDGSSASNIARLDYTNGSCPSILVEPQRTNLALQSSSFDSSGWGKSSMSVTANSTISPSGVVDADTITASSTFNNILQGVSVLASTTYTFSFWVLRGTMTDLKYSIYNVSGTSNIISPTTYYSQTNSSTWTRIVVTFTTPVGCTLINIYPIRDTGVIGTVFLWGAQLEAGSNATSYIPTTTTAVTRNADVISKSGVSDLIGQTEGTLFIDFNFTKTTDIYRRVFAISDGTSNNSISINLTATGSSLEVYVFNGGITQVAFLTNILTANTRYKIAVGYVANNVVLYINGTLRNTDLNCTIPTCSGVYLGKVENASQTAFLNDSINSAMLFKTRLTNTELATLTTL